MFHSQPVRPARRCLGYCLVIVGTALAAQLLPAAQARAANEGSAADFRAAKPAIQQALHAKPTEKRIEGLKQLEKFPGADAAKLALGVAVKDESPEVREAAYACLGTIASDDAARKFLLDSIEREMRRKEPGETSLPLLSALMQSKSEPVFRDTSALLDKTVETSFGARLMAVEMTDRLAERGSDDDVALLVRLSTTDAFAHQFGFRRSVILALIRIDSKPAIGALVGLVDKIDGEVQADAIKYLTSVTNQALGNNQAAWAQWWAENSEAFLIPPLEKRTLAAAESVSPGVTLYYGLPMYATRIVFIMDTSNSMIGPRLEAAKRELCKAIDALRSTDQFTVLVFDRSVRVWQKKPVPADTANKKKAIQFVKKQGTQLMTASFDALEAALEIDAEAIFFLTDGAPFGGKIAAPAEIVRVITAMNRSRRESIYTVGIAPGRPGSPMETFLKTLADANYGVFRRVDE